MTLQLLASNMEGHGTVLIANIVHQVLTARPVQLLTAVMIIQQLALKPAEHGRVRIVKCLKVQALLTVPIIPAPLTAVTTRQLRALNPGGTWDGTACQMPNSGSSSSVTQNPAAAGWLFGRI